MVQIDIPMPKGCLECKLLGLFMMCPVTEEYVFEYAMNGKRPDNCPLKELDKMSEGASEQ